MTSKQGFIKTKILLTIVANKLMVYAERDGSLVR